MSRVLLGAVILQSLAATAQEAEALAPPANVSFHSVDYRNILAWTVPTNGPPTKHSLRFYVQWKIYGEPHWADVAGCQGIQRLRCDLSNVTSVTREWYYARVQATTSSSSSSSTSSRTSSRSPWTLSPRFSPRWDTKITPPPLKLNVMERGVSVRVKPPKQHVLKMPSSLQYRIYLIHPGGKEELFAMDSNRITLNHLRHRTKYCLQSQTVIVYQAKSSARGPKKCFTTL
ncbi:interleukin-22 receptor subunit alpha-2-like [Nelusetta ayraudi]|uniref:interleukin-22 receptor subunit alpha-2-like n=1 Tax=Nelusetta ayraudi TaxID=303726 RepID=UPI003F7310D3